MHNHKPAKINAQPVIKFKYVDKYGNTVDVNEIQERREIIRRKKMSEKFQ